VGHLEQALGPATEAVAIYRPLAKTAPDAYQPDLAKSLNTLDLLLANVGRGEQVLAAGCRTLSATATVWLAAPARRNGLPARQVHLHERAWRCWEWAVAVRAHCDHMSHLRAFWRTIVENHTGRDQVVVDGLDLTSRAWALRGRIATRGACGVWLRSTTLGLPISRNWL
jgi:hypothetical protein